MFDFSQAPVTLILLMINVLVSVYALFFDQSLVDRMAFKPRAASREMRGGCAWESGRRRCIRIASRSRIRLHLTIVNSTYV